MKFLSTTWAIFSFMGYGIWWAVTHPRTPIIYHNRTSDPPVYKQGSPIPWWGSVGVILIGVICWVIGTKFQVTGLDEAARAMVYVPLGNLFGLSLQKRGVIK